MGAPTLGFCIFNHAAVATSAFLKRGFKVLVIDFDAHHGNGTQDILWYEPRALHIDIHQHGIYPGTGYVNEIGGGEAEGTKINIPLRAGSGDMEIAWIASNVVEPLSEVFKPDAVVVSAGFDGFIGDPITGLSISRDGYTILGQLVRKLWEKSRRRALVVVLEGGYGEGLKTGFKSFLEGLLLPVETPPIKEHMPRDLAGLLKGILAEYWGLR